MGSAAQYFEVEAPVAQVYAYWRDFSNFPAFMPDVKEVTVTGSTTSHWKVSGPLGKSVEWDAEIVEDLPTSASPGAAWATPTYRTLARCASTTAGRPPTSRCRWSTTRLR